MFNIKLNFIHIKNYYNSEIPYKKILTNINIIKKYLYINLNV